MRIVCRFSFKVGLIRNSDCLPTSEQAVIFYNYHSGIHHVNDFPNPVIIPVHIDTQNSNPPLKPSISNDCVNVFPGDKVGKRGEIVFPKEGILPNKGDVRLVAVHNQTGPIIVEQEKSSIGFSIVLDAKFDEALLTGG